MPNTPALQRRYFQGTRPEMRALLPHRRQVVLEIGCGEAAFIASIPGAQERWGIEPDAASASVAAPRLHRLLEGTFEQVGHTLPRRHFDLVICNDVIEHMPDHELFLHRIRDCLRIGGVLIGSVPNIRHYRTLFELVVLRDWQYRDVGVLDCTHLRCFTERSLRRGLQEAGYAIEALHGINGGIAFGRSKWSVAAAAMGWIAIAMSLGQARDIAHLQFGFRARPV